jgi:pimeloyl-ACP methyl ester carboxylesterase
MGALVVGVEHRFFGLSGPDGIAVADSDRSEAEAKAEAKSATDPPWQFLTLENVLADYAAIAESLVGTRGAYRDAKVVSFGGSYGGFLSFMLRVRYPSLFFGSLASAAPISLLGSPVITANPGVWMDTVAAIYQSKRPQCAASVSSTLALLVDLFDQGDQFPLLQSSLSICTLPTPARRSSFLFSVAMAFSQITQFDFPWAPSADKIPYPFEAVCDRFEALSRSRANLANQTQSLAALRFALDVAYNATGSATCFRLGGSATTGAADDLRLHLESRAALSRAMPAVVGSGGGGGNSGGVDFARSWYYITCTYFVLPIRGSPSNASIFFGFNMTYSSAADDAACTYLFPNTGVKRSQSPPILPSDLSNLTRVIFSNFGNDPVLSVSMSAEDSEAVPRGVVSLVMPQAAHTQDIVAAADNEQTDVVNGRSQELSIMLQWLAAGN